MGNCITTSVSDTNCGFCGKELSYRYLRCDDCGENSHYNCAYIHDKNSKKCRKCNKYTLRPLLDNEIDPHRRNTI